MRISDTFVEQMLEKNEKITKEQIASLKEQAKSEKKALIDLAVSSNLVGETEVTKAYAQEIDVPFVEIDVKAVPRDVLKQIPERIARQYNTVVFGLADDGSPQLAMMDPDDVQAISFLQKQLGSDLKIFAATRSNILATLDQYRGNMSSEIDKVMTGEDDADEDADEDLSEEDLSEDSPIAQTVNLIIEYAIKSGSTSVSSRCACGCPGYHVAL